MTTNLNGKLYVRSLKDEVSPQEWEARVNLAACYRLVAHYGMSDMMANHITLRVPGEEDAFLTNAYGLMYEEMTASSLYKIDHEGKILTKPDFGDLQYGINIPGYILHSAIHKARPEVNCVIHTHSWPGMAISSLEVGLLPLNQTSMRFLKISYHDYMGVVLNLDEQESLVKDLGDSEALILRNHGLLTCGATVGEAFNWMHRLELSCKAQLAAMACNSPLQKVSQQVLDETYMNYQPKTRRPYGVMEWPGMLRLLDRMDSSFRE
ncbi:class II aldolase/adducin family protein [Polynucleobacter kasalickyi]|uniref:Ribulose-5-phosphate 4-epimerase/Fuculose-1-phosphate aldolase n=1 Tax=Polynucleobacter kasalickyi TaxID=1938817 RepID=A0A1W1Y258_9BURK|nr:class II aldolase/adducin family protein [Polynucleobacter kasalickyi]SMC30215.1 Ribulose-5-phosphate 4-epimerase/Fuculose-1-phosphate aldolase [Polynucleobacter kasalickyi]